jgi:ATP-dependent helicase/nuclease subunit A
VLILDYKTHRTPPQRPEDVPAPYLRQMAAYRAALAPIYPGRRIDCVLAWTEEPRLMVLPAALLDAHLPSGLGTEAAGAAPGPPPHP